MSREEREHSASAVAGRSRSYPKAWRWLLAGVLAVVAPKCFLCAAGYVIVLAGIGWGGPELCGGSTEQGFRAGAVGVVVVMAGVAAVLLVRVGGRRIRQRGRF